ncbi:MAG: UDP-N-acetylglucosamine 2-epimerase [Candidatus Schekmanbacteria bacterium GWA2_38_11]|uniref:UDP-N-acetylglucosamine 2-epimerase (non-hydrolyzing) n=1 Tax=Candidatus Schekmanbacteria bacterium GWA2_38_11 TaxID=1817876 RepID=A0A1F7RIJ4_9BACT|nr:MAG: UDP-N-acetylglucosamine 2-epimerase [Candidatus Schekmanbacteria bacterium GWA2_38_11]
MNKRPKIMVVFGTRPEAIKLAPVIKKLEEAKHKFKTIVCVTAQHREMLDQVLRLFKIKVKYDLDLMRHNQSLSGITRMILDGVTGVLKSEKPDLVMVQGDTTTTFASSLAAFYQQIKIAHVEAGLRTDNKYSPFPEEINRRMTSVVTDYHFAPTNQSKENLLCEGVDPKKIFVTGNTVIDTLLMTVGMLKSLKVEKFKELRDIDFSKKIILVTGHRRESFGEGFENICRALKKIADINRNLIIIYPVHLNPNVKKPVHRILGKVENIRLINPLNYKPFVYLMEKSYLILTDSGGIQEEAPSLGKPVLVMRDTTERPEGIKSGTVRLVGTREKEIARETQKLMDSKKEYNRMSRAHNPYGDGKASKRILTILEKSIR